jgi:hypothetical protein
MKITGIGSILCSADAIVSEEQKREVLAKTQEYLAASRQRKVIAMRAAK